MTHYATNLNVPIYCCVFVAPHTIVVGGGGGSSRSGVKNRLQMLSIDLDKKELNPITHYDVPKNEDCPMSMDVDRERKEVVCGVNMSADDIKSGKNDHLRIFKCTDDSLGFTSARQALKSKNPDDYQRVTTLSRSKPKFLATGGTNGQFDVFEYPKLDRLFDTPDFIANDEVMDADFNDDGTMVLAASTKQLRIFATISTKGQPTLLQKIERPLLKKQQPCTFRAARFGRGDTSNNIFTIVNSDAISRKGVKAPRKALLSAWDCATWTLKKTRTISQKPVTAFDISQDGKLLAFASSDLSVGIVDAHSLRPRLSVLHAHDFPVTCLRFSPDGSLLVSGSPDNTVRVINLRDLPSGSNPKLLALFFGLFVLLLALLVQWSGVSRRFDRSYAKPLASVKAGATPKSW